MSSNLAIAGSVVQLALIVGQKRSLRSVGGIVAQLVQEETHVDELEVTEHPVEQGASVTDHAFKKPSQLTLRYSWSASPSPQPGLAGLIPTILPQQPQNIVDIYNKFLTMQVNRVLLDVYTGKRAYRNMLLVHIEHDESLQWGNSLPLTLQLQELLLVSTTTATTDGVSAGSKTTFVSSIPVQSGGTFQLLPAPSFNPNRIYPVVANGAPQ